MHEFFILFLCIPVALSQNRECPDKSFRCSNGQCIGSENVCDGAKDCSDGSDETQAKCMSIKCPYFAFRCAYGACVDRSAKCNGVQDCADNSDEVLAECGNQTSSSNNVLCKNSEFACNSGQCINAFLACDGNNDCYDGSDETISQCINIRCPPYGFQCAYGGCIESNKKCDGLEDCKDGSDEDQELCEKKVQKPKEPPKPPRPVNRPSYDPNGGCLLPPDPYNGDYALLSCHGDCRKIPGNLVQNKTVLKYSCNEGYIYLGQKLVACDQGKWDPEPQDCKRMCPPLRSNSLRMTCILNGNEVKCDRKAIPGTKVYLNCKPSYHPVNDPNALFKQTECLENGEWAHQLFRCIPDCGIRINTDVTPLLHDAPEAKREYPWHVGLYYDTSYICGGSIISPKSILTAAHCVYNESTESITDRRKLLVAVGKYRSSLSVRDRHEKRFKVADIHIKDTYKGENSKYAHDIAVIVVEGIIEISTTVMPVCIDQFETYNLYKKPLALGTVVGWGRTEHGTISGVLRVGQFRYDSFSSCYEKASGDFVKYITYDKFCAGLPNGNSLDQGDSGGGLTFYKTDGKQEMHFVYGIVSVRDEKSPDITAFTNITVHIPWLNKIDIAILKQERFS